MDLPIGLPGPEMGRKLYGQHTFNSMAQQAASLQREKGCILAESQAHGPSTLLG